MAGFDETVEINIRADDNTGPGLKSAERNVRGFDNKMSGLSSSIAGYVSVAFGTGAIVAFGDAIQKTGRELDRIETRLKFASGSAELAAENMGFIRSEVDRLGLALIPAIDGFSKLAAAARGTAIEGQATREIFSGISQAAATLGLTADQVGGALTAVEQIISKGKVSAEELRGQLGERLPGAFQIAARAVGVTTAELDKMLSNGEVMSDDFLPKFAAELKRTFQGEMPAAERAVNDFDTQWTLLKDNIWDNGAQAAFVGATGALADLAFAVNSATDATEGFVSKYKDDLLTAVINGNPQFAALATILGMGRDALRDFREESESAARAVDLLAMAGQRTENFGGGAPAPVSVAAAPIVGDNGAAEQLAQMAEFNRMRQEFGVSANVELAAANQEFWIQETLLQAAAQQEQLDQMTEFERLKTEAQWTAFQERLDNQATLTAGLEIMAAQELAIEQQKQAAFKQFQGDALTGLTLFGKKGFEISKVAKIAEATTSGAQAAVDAWKAGMSVGGPAAPAIAAAYTAASIAKTAALINQIKSQKYGGGGGGGGGTGGGGLPGASAGGAGGPGGVPLQPTAQQQPRTEITVKVEGIVTGAVVEDVIIPEINEAFSRNVRMDFVNG